MKVARILYPVRSLGPGNRLVIWTAGCKKKCRGCMSAELWNPDCGTDFKNSELTEIITKYASKHTVDGITISGGDPLEQPEELIGLVVGLKPVINDILVFTGFTLNELSETLSKEQFATIKENVSVLVDGRFEENNCDNNPLRGSANQKIYIFDSKVEPLYKEYCSVPHSVETRLFGTELLFVGIPKQEE